MGFFDKVKDSFREKTRDKVCTTLKSIGVDAKLAENERPETNIQIYNVVSVCTYLEPLI